MDARTRLPFGWGIGPRPAVLAGAPDETAARWITVEASPETVWLWLCQLRRAPYSYDLLDNLGRPSPRIPLRKAADMPVGARIMTMFEVTELERGRYFELRIPYPLMRRVFGDLCVRYEIVTLDDRRCQILVTIRWPGSESARNQALAWGDLLMMRKQLLTLKQLAEQWQRSGFADAAPSTRLGLAHPGSAQEVWP